MGQSFVLCVMALPFGVPEHKRDVSEDSTMEKPQDAKLSEIRQLLEYQQPLGSMLSYVGPKLRRQMKAELTMLEDQIKTLRSEIHSGGCNRLGQMS
jgi:hypothetical protein